MTSATSVRAWRRIPVDDVGYPYSTTLLKKTPRQLRSLTKKFERTRYNGWRNKGNLWRDAMGLDSTHGKTVLDYGCGFGIEALQFVRTGNSVVLADITEDSLALAARVLQVHGYDSEQVLVTSPDQELPKADIFYASGSLHHVPEARAVLERAHESCDEARLLLYSDVAWRLKMETDPPPDTTQDKEFGQWVRAMDSVGHYAEWYDREKVERLNEGLFGRVEVSYVGGLFLAARLTN